MCVFKLLVAEDNPDDMTACRDSVDRYQQESSRSIELVECETVEEALQRLDNSFDGAIIDLKLAENGDEGNQILEKIYKSLLRIPVAILTGTPDSVNREFTYLGVFKKGETGYAEILCNFFEIHDTGLTRIMGGRGKIEQTLNKVFLKNLLPRLDEWKEYGKSDPSGTEKALLRFTLNHLVQVLDGDEDQCFPEEAYIYPPLLEGLKTGSIVTEKTCERLHVILSPACDLVVRSNGNFKTDRILFVEIEKGSFIIDGALNGITKKAKKEKKLKSVLGNNYTTYFHWLPKTAYFDGGFINFRKIATCSKEEFEHTYNQPHIQISPHFVKDILSRFSSYYARQGQPEIERNKIIEEIIAAFGEAG